MDLETFVTTNGKEEINIYCQLCACKYYINIVFVIDNWPNNRAIRKVAEFDKCPI